MGIELVGEVKFYQVVHSFHELLVEVGVELRRFGRISAVDSRSGAVMLCCSLRWRMRILRILSLRMVISNGLTI